MMLDELSIAIFGYHSRIFWQRFRVAAGTSQLLKLSSKSVEGKACIGICWYLWMSLVGFALPEPRLADADRHPGSKQKDKKRLSIIGPIVMDP